MHCGVQCSVQCNMQRSVQCSVKCTDSELGKNTWKQGASGYQLLLLLLLLPEGSGSTTARLGTCRDLAKGVLDQLLCCIHASPSIEVSHHVQGCIARVVEALPEVVQHLPVHALHL